MPDTVLSNFIAGRWQAGSGAERLVALGNGAIDAIFAGASADGTRVFFTTQEQLVASDTDFAIDVYQRLSGTTTRISTGVNGANGPTANGQRCERREWLNGVNGATPLLRSGALDR